MSKEAMLSGWVLISKCHDICKICILDQDDPGGFAAAQKLQGEAGKPGMAAKPDKQIPGVQHDPGEDRQKGV